MNEDRFWQIFFEIHQDLPREGPGDSESTLKAFSMLAHLPRHARILDIGCGPGAQTLDLLSLGDGNIVAVDNHQPFLDQLAERTAQRGLSDRVTLVNGDMFNLDFEEGAFDLIWAEGSIFIIGFENGLRKWKPLLKQDGYLAATEAAWLRPDPPEELQGFWREEYPAIQDIEANLRVITERAGYRHIAHFTLPKSAWWTDYYEPIERKLPILWEKYKDDDEALPVLEMHQREIDLYRKYSDYYGYVFFLMQAS